MWGFVPAPVLSPQSSVGLLHLSPSWRSPLCSSFATSSIPFLSSRSFDLGHRLSRAPWLPISLLIFLLFISELLTTLFCRRVSRHSRSDILLANSEQVSRTSAVFPATLYPTASPSSLSLPANPTCYLSSPSGQDYTSPPSHPTHIPRFAVIPTIWRLPLQVSRRQCNYPSARKLQLSMHLSCMGRVIYGW